jgi:uncharacterized protein
MIFRLDVENFYCFRDRQVVDLEIAENVPDLPGRFGSIAPGVSRRTSKVVALFGPNASGKSTVLRALTFIAWFARDSFQWTPEARLPYERFYDAESTERPTRLRLYFTGRTDPLASSEEKCGWSVYLYDILLGNAFDGSNRVIRETLRRQPEGRGRSHRVFERAENGVVVADVSFRVGGYGSIKIRSNASAIATLAHLGHPLSLKLREAAKTVWSNILLERADPSEADAARMYLLFPDLTAKLNREIERIDLGIRGMQVSGDGTNAELLFHHQGLQIPMRWTAESHGTRSVLKYFPIINHALETGSVAIIDELDASIHPHIVAEIFRWFHDPERNARDAQLWITCHNASLLEELEKEEVFICEKDRRGCARIYGLKDVKAVRRDHNLYRKYMSGVYGGVPLIG